MFHVGETVTYGTSGACEILSREAKQLGGVTRDCLVLKPVYDSTLTICVPMDNEALMAKMHTVMTKNQVLDLISEMPPEPAACSPDMNARRLFYADALKSGDQHTLVGMIRSIYQFKRERLASGKRLASLDENAMREAEHMLYSEFAIALGIEPSEVVPFIRQHIAAQES